ncbi:uncharacterized protein [Hemitrygon akajei]|uniref:uncharacterized protein n=1 Tax=Hemitrygon akajei TaxID=2704970 RepID=UPI003BF9AAF6
MEKNLLKIQENIRIIQEEITKLKEQMDQKDSVMFLKEEAHRNRRISDDVQELSVTDEALPVEKFDHLYLLNTVLRETLDAINRVSVTLDVETASLELEVSEDRKSVRLTGTRRNLPDTGKRFTNREYLTLQSPPSCQILRITTCSGLTRFYTERLEQAIEEGVEGVGFMLTHDHHFNEREYHSVTELAEKGNRAGASKLLLDLVMEKGTGARRVMWESFVKLHHHLPKLSRILNEIRERGDGQFAHMDTERGLSEVPTRLKVLNPKGFDGIGSRIASLIAERETGGSRVIPPPVQQRRCFRRISAFETLHVRWGITRGWWVSVWDAIDDIKKTLDFIFEEVNTLKSDVVRIKGPCMDHEKNHERSGMETIQKNEYLLWQRLRFAEDLTAADKLARQKLWPLGEATGKDGKRALFAGARAFIDGKEIRAER